MAATYIPSDLQQQANRPRVSSTASGRYIPSGYAAAQPQPPAAPGRLASHGYRAPSVTPPYPVDTAAFTGPAPQQPMNPRPLDQLQPPYPSSDIKRPPVDGTRRYSANSQRSRHSHSPARSYHSQRSHRSHRSHKSHHSRHSTDHDHHRHRHSHGDDYDRKRSSRDEPDRKLTRSDTRRPTLGDTIFSLWDGVKNTFASGEKWEKFRTTPSSRHHSNSRG